MPMVHELKTWPEYYMRVVSEDKNFELRKHDRDFQVGDILHLKEFIPEKGGYTGRMVIRKITYLLKGGSMGLEDGFCIMSLTNTYSNEQL
jgi:hypothetical protein